MTAPIFTYETTIDVPYPEEHRRSSSMAIQAAHGWTWGPSNPIPKPLEDAAWLLNAGQRQKVVVDVYADGTRKMRLP